MKLNFEEADRKCGGAVTELGHIATLGALIAATAAANGGERLEETSPSSCVAGKTPLSPHENRNLIPKESSGTKKRQTLVDSTARFALLPLPERTAWLSFKKKGVCARARCEGSFERFMWVYVVF